MNSQPINWLASAAGASGLMDNKPIMVLEEQSVHSTIRSVPQIETRSF